MLPLHQERDQGRASSQQRVRVLQERAGLLGLS